jgi:hypothetical protein
MKRLALHSISGGRVGTGSAVLALPLAAAALTDRPWIRAACLLAACLIVVLVVAPAVPKLDRLPVFGASRPLTAEFTSDSAPGLRVRLQPGTTETVLLRVGVDNGERPDVGSSLVNIHFPLEIQSVSRVDSKGRPDASGGWDESTHNGDRIRYWSSHPVTFPGRSSRVFYFRLTIGSAGRYSVRITVSSPDLHEEFVEENKLVAELVDSQNEFDRINAAIAEAEELLPRLGTEALSADARNAVAVCLFGIYNSIPEAYADHVREAPLNYHGPQVGTDYNRALLTAKLHALYEVRSAAINEAG